VALLLFATPGFADQSWNRVINSPDRFRVLSDFGDAAVLDKETGLVWERRPTGGTPTWQGAHEACIGTIIGNRFGWRLPTIQELATLLDRTVRDGVHPALPHGHPFENVQAFWYWSATSSLVLSRIVDLQSSFRTRVQTAVWGDWAAVVDFRDGDTDNAPKTNRTFAWCVRGGQGVTPQ
jgi:hypothetical protein